MSSQGWKRLGRECLVPPCLGAPGLHPHAPRHLGDRDGGAGEGAAPGGRRPPLRVHPSRERAGTEGQRRGMVRGPGRPGRCCGAASPPSTPGPCNTGGLPGPQEGRPQEEPWWWWQRTRGAPGCPHGLVATQGHRARRGCGLPRQVAPVSVEHLLHAGPRAKPLTSIAFLSTHGEPGGGGCDPDISEKEPRLSEVQEPLRGAQLLTDHTGVLS